MAIDKAEEGREQPSFGLGGGGADAGGAGLRGLRDRVEALDGRLEVESPAGGGTRVSAAIPCA